MKEGERVSENIPLNFSLNILLNISLNTPLNKPAGLKADSCKGQRENFLMPQLHSNFSFPMNQMIASGAMKQAKPTKGYNHLKMVSFCKGSNLRIVS